jgi:hypothetical protein
VQPGEALGLNLGIAVTLFFGFVTWLAWDDEITRFYAICFWAGVGVIAVIRVICSLIAGIFRWMFRLS